MQRKDLALRVLSTAAIMSIVTSIAAPAFADIYYIGNGSIDVETITSTDGKQQYVKVTQGNKTYTDTSNEIVIKDGTDEDHTTLREDTRIKEKRAEVAVPDKERTDTQELEAAGSADAAGESQPDPDAGFTLSEAEEDSAQPQEGKDTTEEKKEPAEDSPKKDVVYEYAPAADPNPEQQATKPASTAPAEPEEKTLKTTQADATTTPAAEKEPYTELEDVTVDTAYKPKDPTSTASSNWISVINDCLNKALNIRLSNVNIKRTGPYGLSAMTVSGNGDTKIELDGKNILDSSSLEDREGLNKQGNGTMTITDEKTDDGEIRTSKAAEDETGSLTVVGGNYAAGIGGNSAPSTSSGLGDTKNITIEGYATVDATSCQNTIYSDLVNGGAAIGGGRYGSAENITIQGNANVTARTKGNGAAIGGGVAGSGTNIGIYDHATVTATTEGTGAAIGRGSQGQKASVIIGREGKTQENENVHVTAKSHVSAIGGMAGDTGTAANQTTDIVIQGGATIDEASCTYGAAIGGDGGCSNVIIRGHAVIKKAGLIGGNGFYHYNKAGEKATVSVEDHARLEDVRAIGGQDVEEANVTVKDNAYVGAVLAIGDFNRTSYSEKIEKVTAKILGNATIESLSGWIGKRPYSTVGESEVIVDSGENGKVTVKATELNGSAYINANTVQIKNNVLLKLKQSTSASEPNYIAANGVEMTRDKLMQTIGADAEIWYTDKDNKLQKIVHGKNVCKKADGVLTGNHENATCGKDGYDEYQCGYEHANHAKNTSCDLTWREVLKATGAHTWGDWKVTTPATCTANGSKERECSVCHQKETEPIPALNHDFHGTETVTKAATCAAPGTKTVKCTRCDAVDTQTIPIDRDAHNYQDDWTVTTPATCTTPGVETRYCHNDHNHSETRPTAKDSNNHAGHGTHIEGYVAPTCTKDGYTGDTYCNGCNQKIKDGTVIPATGHHWKDNGDGTHTCPDCGATEGQPVNTNSALELRVVDAEGMDQPFTVSQNGTLRTYTGAYDTATLTGELDTLRYLQEHGAQTIQFVTNGQTSSFAINDLLAQGSGSEVFYLTHRGAEEPTLLLVEADHSELVKD